MREDLIRRSDAVDALRKAFNTIPPLVKAKCAVESIPAVDAVEVRHGWWTRVDYEMVGHDYICSECGEKNDSASRWCPDCGARMDGCREDGPKCG